MILNGNHRHSVTVVYLRSYVEQVGVSRKEYSSAEDEQERNELVSICFAIPITCEDSKFSL